jgi:predicted esterase
MRRYLVFALLLCLVCPAMRAQGIDPYRPDAGDFLDTDVDALAKQARDAYQAAKYEDAARLFLVTLRYNVRDAGNIYDLACCYGLLGKADLAAKYLQRAVKAGFGDVEHVKRDTDFDKVRKEPVFAAVVDGMAAEVKKRDEGAGEAVYFDAPTFVKCRVVLPEGYDPKKAYTLVVGLHGYGDAADRFVRLSRWLDRQTTIFAVPETQYPFGTGTETGCTWVPQWAGMDDLGRRARRLSEDYVVSVTRGLKARYKTKDVYLMGFSQGCMMAYTVGIKNSGLFKGIVCFGGWLDTDWLGAPTIEKAKRLRVFIAHGKKDPVVSYDSAEKARDALTKNGNDVTFVPFDGVHQVQEAAFRSAVEWMGKGQ